MNAPWWFQALTIVLNAIQTVALAYIYTRWRKLNGSGTPAGGWRDHRPPAHHAPTSGARTVHEHEHH